MAAPRLRPDDVRLAPVQCTRFENTLGYVETNELLGAVDHDTADPLRLLRMTVGRALA
jgi:hypothetical protein